MDVGLGDRVCPLARVIGLLRASVKQDGTGAVDEEHAKVAITALGDAAEAPLEATRECRSHTATPSMRVRPACLACQV